MKKNQHLITIRGAKGKGGGGSTFEADDNMFARQSAAFIDAIAEGPIKGLVYGDASILVDETRLRNVNQATGRVSSSTNFNNFTVLTKNGDATQVVDADFFAEYPSAAYMEEINSAELLESEPQFFTISSGTFEKRETDYVKVTVSTTGMSAITKKGDNKGDINETSVYFTIDFHWVDNSGTHHAREMFDTGFQGKVSGKYAHTFGFNIEEIKRTSTINDWSVKVTKLATSPDSTDSIEIQNAVYVDSIEAAIADKLEYPYTAYVGGVIDAEAFNSVPARGYEIDGKLIQIPSNHYPCDYNGRKLVCNDASSFAVGDTISQTASITSLTASGTDEEGYTATATLSAAHGVALSETFKATIATTSSTDEEFWEGEFVCTATTTTAFTYTLNKPFNETTGKYKTLSSTTCGGTKTAELFAGGLVDKKVGNTLYLRNVAAESSAIQGTITNGDGDSTTVSSSTQVFIPANYRRNASTEKPVTQEQDWDGTFYQSWCNNPAWVYNDLIINKIYGLGNYLGQTQVNKWELFQIGRYCDELVPAGVEAADLLSIHCTDDTNYIPSGSTGQHEPRFSANLVISGKNEAYKVLNDVTSIFRAMTYWLNGEAYLVQDSEKDPVYQFTNANVIEGQFSYEGTANKTRTNSIIVNWNNPQDYYRTRSEIVELEESLQKDDEFIKPEETTAFGCTSRGQARRLGKWKLLTNNWNTNTVSFSTSINAAFLRPGDIVQVIDQNKEGKSWGGRVSANSSTTVVNIDRKPTGFVDGTGTDGAETGYSVADYRLTVSYVGYKAILAQDTATIGGTSYVRGEHLTSITTEEDAARQQDDNNNLVFVQWTPFTYTETKTLSEVSNSGKTLTVSSAFTIAPKAEAIWVLSRAALATGKTKLEAKLFRVMSIAESDKNIFEITGLEYNASKFDAVDKNEALTQYRTIYLPDSFKEVPQVENIDVEPRIKASSTGGTVNSLVVDWDPAKNSDGTLYTSVRHYEVEYSTDNERWFRAGTNTNTEYEITDNADIAVLSGTYYFRVYLVSLNGVRGPVTESGAIVVDFNRAVGPAEGSVGTTTFYINFIGNISGDFTLESGKVTFSPTNIFHNDGVNEHAVNSQSQLDFTGLDHTSTTGGDEGYVFFDHSASQFKAIAFDETSGQFYPVGSSVFATATGTLTASTSNKPRLWTGLDSTVFTTELAVGNVFKYVNGSNTRYHRVKRISSNTALHTFNPTNDTIVNSDNQAFSKPNFLVDYKNDTIMGKVTKTGASTYTLQKFGSVQGESGYSVEGTNQNFTFDSNNDGTVTNESAYTCDFTVKRGSQAYTFASSGDAQNTFGISLQARSGFDNDSDIEIDSNGQITVGDGDMDDHTTATATMRLFDRGRADLLIADKILSFSKTAQGTAGEDAKLVVVTPSSQLMTKIVEPDEGRGAGSFTFYSPDSITVTAQCTNTTQNGTWSVSGGTATTNNTITNGKATATVSSSQIVDDMILTYTLHADDGGAADSTQLHIAEFFDGAVQPIFDNIAHVFPASKTGVVGDYTGSGGTIKLYQGLQLLDYDGVGTSNGHWKVVVNNDSNITEGAISSTGSSGVRYATIADHSGMADNTDKIILTYTITGKATDGTDFTFAPTQTLTKSKTGADGVAGSTVNFAFVRVPTGTSASDVTATTNGTSTTPANFSISGSTYIWSDTVPSGTGLLYAVEGTKAGTASGFTWGTPYRLEGTMAKELIIYSDVTTGSAPADPTATYNFTTGVLSLTGANASSWNLTPPSFGSTPADGAKVYAVTCVVTGSINDTSVAVAATDWSAAFIHAIHEKGDEGPAGDNVKLVKLYTSKSTTPTAPSTSQGFNTSTGAAVAGTYQSSAWTTTPGTPTAFNKIWIATATLIQTNGVGNYAVDGAWDVGVHSSSEIKVVVAYYNKTSSPNTAPNAPTAEVTSTATTANQWTLTRLTASSGSVVWQVIGSNATGSFVYGPVFRAFNLDGLDALTGLNFSSGSGLGVLNLTTNDYLNSQIDAGDFNITDLDGYVASTYENPSVATVRGYFSGSGINTTTGVITNTTYSASDFNINDLAGLTGTDLTTFQTSKLGLGGLAFKANITDSDLAGSATITKTSDFGFSSILVTSGSQTSGFYSYDGGTSYNSQGTTGTVTVTPTLSSGTSQSCTFTWSRSSGNVSGFALTNTGTGNDAWTNSSFGSAAAGKAITVTHTASGLNLTLNCQVTTTTSSSSGGGSGGGGGCFLPGSMVELENGEEKEIEKIEIGEIVRGGRVTNKMSYSVDHWYKLNNLDITGGHPVWIEDKGWCCIEPEDYYKECEWYNVEPQLSPMKIEMGDMTTAGEVTLLERVDEKAFTEVWNITVEGEHTYYVNGILVHNAKY